jgi:hypothetical protein
MYASDSMAEFDTEVIIKFCERYIKYREDYIEKEHQQHISKEMQPKSYLFGLITFKGKTEEEAEYSWENSGDMFSPKDLAHFTGLSEYNEISDLLTLAKNTNKPTIFISRSMSFIFKY